MGLVGFFVESLRGRTFGVREFIPAFPAFATNCGRRHFRSRTQTKKERGCDNFPVSTRVASKSWSKGGNAFDFMILPSMILQNPN